MTERTRVQRRPCYNDYDAGIHDDETYDEDDEDVCFKLWRERGDRLTNDCVNIKSLFGIKDNFLDDHDHGDHDHDLADDSAAADDDSAADDAADEFLKRKGSQQC